MNKKTFEVTKKDENGWTKFVNVNYKDESKFEVFLFNRLLVGKNLFIIILWNVVAFLLFLLMINSIGLMFLGAIILYWALILIFSYHAVERQGLRSYEKMDTENKYKVGKLYEINEEPQTIKRKK